MELITQFPPSNGFAVYSLVPITNAASLLSRRVTKSVGGLERPADSVLILGISVYPVSNHRIV